MGVLTSRLIAELIDRVSGPARHIDRSLDKLERRTNRMRTPGDARLAALSRSAAVGVGGVAAAAVAAKGYREFAATERRFTHIAETANATREQQQAALAATRQIAQRFAVPFADVTDGLEALVEAGRSLPEAMDFLPSVTATALASRGAVSDVAKTADALGASLGIAGKDAQQAFDILVAGGRAGKFELRQMAQYLPSLAPVAASLGMTGLEGAKKIAAALQMVFKQSGTAEEAANGLRDLLTKMETTETVKKFEKFGVDVPKAMKKARAEGKDLLETFIELTEKATGGDLSKLPQLFGEMDSRRGISAMIKYKKEWKALVAALGVNVEGTVLKSTIKLTEDAQAQIDRTTNAYHRLLVELGRGVDTFGGTAALNEFSDDLSGAIDQIEAARARGSKWPVLEGLNEHRKAGLRREDVKADVAGRDDRRRIVEKAQRDVEAAERRRGELDALPDLTPAKKRHIGYDLDREVAAARDASARARTELEEYEARSPAVKVERETADRKRRSEEARRRGVRGGRAYLDRGAAQPESPARPVPLPPMRDPAPPERRGHLVDDAVRQTAAPPLKASSPQSRGEAREAAGWGALDPAAMSGAVERGVTAALGRRPGEQGDWGARPKPQNVEAWRPDAMRDRPRPTRLDLSPEPLAGMGLLFDKRPNTGGVKAAMQDLVGEAGRVKGEIEGAFAGIDLQAEAARGMSTFQAGLVSQQAEILAQSAAFMARLQAIYSKPIRPNIQAPAMPAVPAAGGAAKPATSAQAPRRTDRVGYAMRRAYENLA